MLDAARLQPGHRVLDLAAGSGDQTLPAARRVLPGGSVLAVDISQRMLEQAEAAARAAGLSNIETLVADGSVLDVPEAGFDAAICRLGLMFMSDLQHALATVHRAVKPGGRFAAVVWSSGEKNPYFNVLVEVVRESGRLPSNGPSLLTATSLGEPPLLQAPFECAGFRDVAVERIPIVRDFDSVDQAIWTMRETSSGPAELMRDMTQSETERVWSEVAERLNTYVDANGRCALPGEVLLGHATR
jgi:SAM-dependent methyltransferase